MRQSPRTLAKQQRARYARTNQPYGNLLVNNPDGFPSQFPPVQEPIWWWGNDTWNRPLGPATGLSAVTRATSLITSPLAALPWRILTGGPTPATSSIEAPVPRWLNDPQLHRPDDRFGPSPIPAALRSTASAFWAQWVRSALWHGMGYLIFEEGMAGEPVAGTLRVLNPQMVGSKVNDDGDIVRTIGSQESGGTPVETDWNGYLRLGSRRYRLIELPNPNSPMDEYGVAQGVLTIHARELEMAGQAIRYGSGMYRSGVPSGYLKTSKPNFDKVQADRLREQWMDNHGGDTRSVAVLNATTEFHPIALSPVDMALVATRQLSLLDISNAFGVPTHMLGYDASSSNTYSNAESRSLDFRQFSLMPWATVLEEVLTSLIATGTFVTVDFRGLLRPDTQTRYQSYSTALKDGWLTVNEVRMLENLPPLTTPEEPISEIEAQEGISDGNDDADDSAE